jgi:hypothetical protein
MFFTVDLSLGVYVVDHRASCGGSSTEIAAKSGSSYPSDSLLEGRDDHLLEREPLLSCRDRRARMGQGRFSFLCMSLASCCYQLISGDGSRSLSGLMTAENQEAGDGCCDVSAALNLSLGSGDLLAQPGAPVPRIRYVVPQVGQVVGDR